MALCLCRGTPMALCLSRGTAMALCLCRGTDAALCLRCGKDTAIAIIAEDASHNFVMYTALQHTTVRGPFWSGDTTAIWRRWTLVMSERNPMPVPSFYSQSSALSSCLSIHPSIFVTLFPCVLPPFSFSRTFMAFMVILHC